MPLVITEGEKKAIAADQFGFPCVGLVGVYGWTQKRVRDADGRGSGPRKLIPDLEAIPWQDRRVTFIFDSDAATNDNVKWAEHHLAETLKKLGADVRVVCLPSGPDGDDGKPVKVGLDDFLVVHGPEKLRELIDAAVIPDKPAPVDDGRCRVRLGPDEHRVNDVVVKALANDPSIYQRCGELARIVADENVPGIQPIPPAALRDIVSRLVVFYSVVGSDNDGNEKIEIHHPPPWSIAAVSAWTVGRDANSCRCRYITGDASRWIGFM